MGLFRKKRKPKRIQVEQTTSARRELSPEVRQARTTCLLMTAMVWVALTKVIGWHDDADLSLLGCFGLVGIGTFSFYTYVRGWYSWVLERPSTYFGMILLISLSIVGARVLLEFDLPLSLSPLLIVGMLLALTQTGRLAMAGAFFQLMGITLLLCLQYLPNIGPGHAEELIGSLFQVWSLFPAVLIVVFGVRQIRNRSKLVKVGFYSGVMAAAVVLAALWVNFLVGRGTIDGLFGDDVRSWTRPTWAALANGLMTGFLISGLLPFIEKGLGLTTDISLLELSDLNQPLLKQLQLKAPGTYHHSLIMSSLAEAAAERIGANGLLCRVGCYYHDIGKTNKPEYFVENMVNRADSKHKKLSPRMSTLVIISHVKDGLEMADYYGLPKSIREFIASHHGTSVVEYFYREALEKTIEQGSENDNPDRESFRYPGPKPQTRETGIVMVADSVEAATRSLSEPTPSKIEGLVHDIIVRRLMDGQLDECNLTMKDLAEIEHSFIRVLAGIYHGRIKYPGQEEEEAALAAEVGEGGEGGDKSASRSRTDSRRLRAYKPPSKGIQRSG